MVKPLLFQVIFNMIALDLNALLCSCLKIMLCFSFNKISQKSNSNLFIVVSSINSVTYSLSGTSFHSDNLVKLKDVIPKDEPIVFVVGAMAHGSVSLFTFQQLSCKVLFGWNSWNVTILSAKHIFTSLMFNSFFDILQFKLSQATTS